MHWQKVLFPHVGIGGVLRISDLAPVESQTLPQPLAENYHPKAHNEYMGSSIQIDPDQGGKTHFTSQFFLVPTSLSP